MNDSINAKLPQALMTPLKGEFGVQVPRQSRYLITKKMAAASSTVMSKDKVLQRFSRMVCFSITLSPKSFGCLSIWPHALSALVL